MRDENSSVFRLYFECDMIEIFFFFFLIKKKLVYISFMKIYILLSMYI